MARSAIQLIARYQKAKGGRRKARREFALIVEGAVMNSFTLHQNVFFTKAMQSELVLKR